MSGKKSAPELGRLTLTGTGENKSYSLELALHEPAYDEEVQAWQCEGFIYGYENRPYRMVGYGATNLQSLSMFFQRTYQMLDKFIRSGIHIELYDLLDGAAINLLSTRRHGDLDTRVVPYIAAAPTWISTSSFRSNIGADELTLQIGKPFVADNSWLCAARIEGLSTAKGYVARDAITAICAAMRGLDCDLSELESSTVLLEEDEPFPIERYRSFYFVSPSMIINNSIADSGEILNSVKSCNP